MAIVSAKKIAKQAEKIKKTVSASTAATAPVTTAVAAPVAQAAMARTEERAVTPRNTATLENQLANIRSIPASYTNPTSAAYKQRVLLENALAGNMPSSQGQLQLLNRLAKPNVAQFMEATGADFNTAGTILGQLTFNQRDPRDWAAIMGAADPLAAARAASGQAIAAGAYQGARPQEYMYQKAPIGQVGNIAAYQYNIGRDPYLKFGLLSPEGVPLGSDFFTNPERAQYELSNLGQGLTQEQIDQLRTLTQNFYQQNPSGRGAQVLNTLSQLQPFAAPTAPNYLVSGMNPSLFYGIDWQQPQAQMPAQRGAGMLTGATQARPNYSNLLRLAYQMQSRFGGV